MPPFTSLSVRRVCRSNAWGTALFATLLSAGCFWGSDAPAFAQFQFVSLASGRNGDGTVGSTNNLTTYKGGTGLQSTTTYSSSLISVSVYSTYNATTHVLSGAITPTNVGYSTTPFVGSNGGNDTYTGGPATTTAPNGTVLTSQSITPYNPTLNTTGGDVGYYDYKVSFTFSSATTLPYSIFGTTNEDNEIQDVIVNYTPGTGAGTVATLMAQNGSEIRTTNNKASNASFFTGPVTNNGNTQTVDFIVYNQSGATNMNFAMNAALPEPTALLLLFPGAVGIGALSRRRRTIQAQ